MKLINKEDFAKVASDQDVKTFVIYVSSLTLESMIIYPAGEARKASLLTKEGTVLMKHTNFADIFLKKLAKVLS